ncbi:class I SAM-dependent methyltransferase [Candidatus Wolfebacteria bacterium]|nr:class I SAM-dependent methyltransferase [Candidatus Wolfebacteria bacterium]
MPFQTFDNKWIDIKNRVGAEADEKSLFVAPGNNPVTQRQLNLYNYFLFIKNLVRDGRFKDILEVGCGRGTMSLYIKEYLNKDVALLDKEIAAIDLAKKDFEKRKLRANFHVGDALKTQLTEESFDAIVSVGLAEHIDDVGGLFKEQYRLLRPGGVMISLNIPKKFSIQILNIAMRFVKKILGKYKAKVKSDYYRNKLQARDYARIAEEAGFKNVKIVHACPFPLFTPIDISLDKKITKLYKVILAVRRVFQEYPYQTNSLFGQAHFLVGYK